MPWQVFAAMLLVIVTVIALLMRATAASVTNDPNVLVSKCLDAAREAHISPLGCWPSTTAVPTVPAR